MIGRAVIHNATGERGVVRALDLDTDPSAASRWSLLVELGEIGASATQVAGVLRTWFSDECQAEPL